MNKQTLVLAPSMRHFMQWCDSNNIPKDKVNFVMLMSDLVKHHDCNYLLLAEHQLPSRHLYKKQEFHEYCETHNINFVSQADFISQLQTQVVA